MTLTREDRKPEKRKPLTLAAMVSAFLEYALCPDCGEPYAGDAEFDHPIALAEGGKDWPEQTLCPVHKKCHAKRTSEHRKRIAKVKRMAGETGQQARRARAKAAGKHRGIPSRKDPWPAKGSRKLQSRPMRNR